MRKRIIDWIFTLQSQRGILGEKERRLYTYAYGLLLNKIAIYAIIAIVGTITGNWIGMFSFLLPFTILRQYAGGIHLEKPMNCIIFSGFLVFGCGQYLAVASDIPMSSLQCAYMIERERGLKTTGTPCHVYMEFDTVSINETHLRKAWETLYVRHPMMRAKAEMCGLLKIEELNDREAERTIKIWEEDIFIKENMREILSHEKLDIRNGINCRLHLIKRHQKIVRLAFDLDLTMCDVLSFLIILRDLGEFYRYFKRGIIREYHSNEIEEEVLLSENRKSDKVYWEQRLRNSDIAFPLKVKGSIEELVKTKYISINRKMDKKVLDRLTLKLKISTEEILLIVFSYTVLKYTKKEQVLINFPFSNRTKERQNRVGDYTKSIIYRCDIKRGVAFNEFCKAMHKKYKEDIKHVDLDGVSVQRILKNHCQGNEKYPVPLVFSPSFEIPMLSEVFLNEIGDLSYIISQTPGVWLDAQVYQLKQDFFFSWVILEGILDETELSEMMDLYIKILTEIDKSEGGNLDE